MNRCLRGPTALISLPRWPVLGLFGWAKVLFNQRGNVLWFQTAVAVFAGHNREAGRFGAALLTARVLDFDLIGELVVLQGLFDRGEH